MIRWTRSVENILKRAKLLNRSRTRLPHNTRVHRGAGGWWKVECTMNYALPIPFPRRRLARECFSLTAALHRFTFERIAGCEIKWKIYRHFESAKVRLKWRGIPTISKFQYLLIQYTHEFTSLTRSTHPISK